MANRVATAQAGAVIWWGDRIVLCRNKRGRWYFPHGELQRDETPAATAERETESQTGLLVELLSELGWITGNGEQEPSITHYFLFRVTGQNGHWERHLGVDTFLLEPDSVLDHLSSAELRSLWARKWQEIDAARESV